MGNSNQKKKKIQTETNFPVSPSPSSSVTPSREKPKGSWLDKLKTAGPKGNEDQKRLSVHYATSQHYQENVFIEGSRPQYLEDLHTEAQEGLKILQQEEHKNGVNFVDNESIASADTLCPENDISSKDEGGSPESRSTTANTESTVTSAVSTRPVLTRQGSTFKPLNPVKRLDKTRKRSRRTTIMGIPNQVQKELALHRNSTFQPLASTQLPNHNGQVTDSQSGVVIIPTVDEGTPEVNKEGARVHLSELEASGDEQLLRKHLRAVYQDEQLFYHQGFGSHLFPSSVLRPKSLAVPGMTTSSFSPSMFSYLQEPQGPVMSMSPQATYLSTIIPNAVLPASIDVIEIDRSRGRGNSVNHGGRVRTVSKSSLASLDSSVSPLLSRRSEDGGSQTDESHSNSTPMPVSVSESNRSESSKTIISNSSPISSKGSTHSYSSQRVSLNEQESQAEQFGGDQDHVSLHSSVSMISCPSSKNKNVFPAEDLESAASGSVVAGEETKNKRNSTRNCSLSVMKTKQPPAPPQRTNSLHNNNIKSNFRVLVNKDLNGSASGEIATAAGNIVAKDEIKSGTTDYSKISALISDSTGSTSASASSSSFNPTQVSSSEAGGATEPRTEFSPQKIPSEGGKFERTMSPSSGYSSQSGTPTLSPKAVSPTSPDKQKKKPIKPERSMSRASSSAASPSSSLTSLSSGTSEPVNPDVSTCSQSLPPQGLPLTARGKELTPNNKSLKVEVGEFLNIPPPPKIKAPCPPPPETWVHNRRTFELLCGPCTNVSKISQNPAQIQDSNVKQMENQTEASKELQVLVEKQTIIDQAVSELTESKAKTETVIATIPEGVHKNCEGRESPATKQEALMIQGRVEANADVQRQEQTGSPVVMDPESQDTSPKKDPPPVMKRPMTVLHREELKIQSVEGQQKEICSSATIEVNLPVENHTTSSQNRVTALVYKCEDEVDRNVVPYMEILSVDAPKTNKASPPPTPPPAYQPTPPLSRRTPPSSVSVPPDELQKVQEEIHSAESCWPPPPPPLEGDSVFDGGDEIDFPPPPPPFTTDGAPDVKDSSTEAVPNRPTVALQEVEDAIKDSIEAERPLHGQNSDLPPSVTQTTVNDDKSELIMQVSKANNDGPVQNVSSVSYSVLPPPMEGPPLLNVTTIDNLSSVSSFLKPDSLNTEAQFPSEPLISPQLPPPITVPAAPPLPVENLSGVNFKRQPSIASRTKELLARHKSVPIPKEDANIPLVTPSLLQMVRLRSVNLVEDQMNSPSKDKSSSDGALLQEHSPVSIPGPQHIPQKPIRKSLSVKSSPQTVKASSVTLNTPSMRLQEAIRMKTAAMSSRDGLPSRLSMRPSTYSEPGGLSLKSPEGCDMYKSPASTASFIFSRSTKKVVIGTAAATSPEAQASLKQSLAAEFMQISDQSNTATISNGEGKVDRVPPPVARKPSHSSMSSHNLPASSTKMELSDEGNGATEAGQHTRAITPPETTTTRVTEDTIETLF